MCTLSALFSDSSHSDVGGAIHVLPMPVYLGGPTVSWLRGGLQLGSLVCMPPFALRNIRSEELGRLFLLTS